MAHKVNYWKKTKEELVEISKALGIEMNEEEPMNRKELIHQIVQRMAVLGKLTGAVAFDEDGNQITLESDKEFFNVLFHEQEGATKYVFLGVNGVSLYLPREVKMRLPIRFKAALDDAVSTRVVPAKDALGRMKGVKIQRVPRFSYQILPD